MNQEIITNNETQNEQLLLPFDPPLEQRSPDETDREIADLRAQNDELRLQLRQRESRDLVTQAMRSAGARSPELLYEAARSSLQFGEDGSLENAEAVVSEMKSKFPEQFGEPVPRSIDGGAGRGPSSATLTKEALSKMKPDEIARLDWDTVREVLAN